MQESSANRIMSVNHAPLGSERHSSRKELARINQPKRPETRKNEKESKNMKGEIPSARQTVERRTNSSVNLSENCVQSEKTKYLSFSRNFPKNKVFFPVHAFPQSVGVSTVIVLRVPLSLCPLVLCAPLCSQVFFR